MSAYFGYLKGVSNELALKHVPYVVPRNDTLAGPRGRRGDQVLFKLSPIQTETLQLHVGGPIFPHK